MPFDTFHPGRAPVLFLKATTKKKVWIPQFTKKNGQVVGGHYAMVHVSDDHSHEKVASGQGSYSQKKAHAALAKEEGAAFDALPVDDKAALVMHHATQIQDGDSMKARLSTLKAKIAKGEKPLGSEWKAYHAAPPDLKQQVLDAVHAADKLATFDAQYAAWHAANPDAVKTSEPAPAAPKAGMKVEPAAEPTPAPKAAPASATQAAEAKPVEPEPAKTVKLPDSALAMPDFIEGKDIIGVKTYYEKVAQKVIEQAEAGNAAVLEDMLESGLKPNAKGKVTNTWKGKTPNSKLLLALHAAALAHAKGEPLAEAKKEDAEAVATEAKTERATKFEGAKKDPHKELAATLGAAGFPAMVGSKGVLMASSPDYPKTYANKTQAMNAAVKLTEAGFDAEVIGEHPFYVKVHGKMADLPKATVADPAGKPQIPETAGYKPGVDTKPAKPEKPYVSGWTLYSGDVEQALEAGDKVKLKELIDLIEVDGEAPPPEAKSSNALAYAKQALAYLEAQGGDAGPKDGDTKEGADGTLVFKDGRWHKQGESKPAAALALSDDEMPEYPDNLPALQMVYCSKAGKAADAGDLAGAKHALAELGHKDGKAHDYIASLIAKMEAKQAPADASPAHAYLKHSIDTTATVMEAAKEWKAANPGKDAELASALDDLGFAAYAQKLGLAAEPVAAQAVDKHAKQSLIDSFHDAKVSLSNTNAKSFNPKVDQIAAALEVGDVAALQGMKFGVNTYGKKLTKMKEQALALLGEKPPVKKVVVVRSGAPTPAGPKLKDLLPPGLDSAELVNFGITLKVTSKTQAHLPVSEWIDPEDTAAYEALSPAQKVQLHAAIVQWNPQAGENLKKWLDWHDNKDAQPNFGMYANLQPDVDEAAAKGDKQTLADIADYLSTPQNADQPGSAAMLAYVKGKQGAAPAEGLADDEIPEPWMPNSVTGSNKQKLVDLAKEGDIEGLKAQQKEFELSGMLNTAKYAKELAAILSDKKAGIFIGKPGAKVAESKQITEADLPKMPTFESVKNAQIAKEAQKLALENPGDLGVYVELVLQGPKGQVSKLANYVKSLKNAVNEANGLPPAYTDVEGAAPAAGQGPKEGDTKQGAEGVLIFENGRWHKLGDSPATLKKKAASVLMPKFSGTNAVKMGKIAKALKQIAEEGGADGLALAIKDSSMAGKATIAAGGYSFSLFKDGVSGSTNGNALITYAAKLQAAMAGTKAAKAPKIVGATASAATSSSGASTAAPQPSGPQKNAATAAVKKVPLVAILNGGIPEIDGKWKKTGEQKGSNSGGFYTDPDGRQWYVKTPESDAHVQNELLANKLYAALGVKVPEVKRVRVGGKLSIASKVIDGLKKDPEALKHSADMANGFAADAWLGNWDAVGLGYDNALVDKQGGVHRIDPGGALLYRAQGAAKGAAFGNAVTEFDTLRDAVKNPQAASVYAHLSPEQVKESVKQVLLLKDSAIQKLVMAYGPGDKAAKEALAAKLIARKADIAAKFPDVAAEVAPKKIVQIAPAPNFMEWNGPGQGLSSKAHVNQQNQELANQMQKMASDGHLAELENMHYQPIDKDTGAALGEKQHISQHKSKHIPMYWKDLVNAVKNPVESVAHMKDAVVETVGGVFGTLVSAFDEVKKLTESAVKIGRYALVGAVDGDPFETWNVKELSLKNGAINAKELYDQSHKAYNALTAIEKQAIKEYTGSGYSSMNNAATGVGTHGKTDQAIEGINKASVPLKPGTVLSRKFSFGSAGDMDKFLNAEGGIVQDFGIISTSLNPGVWGGNVHLRIVCGEGVKGCYVAPDPVKGGSAISHFPGEQEVILPYGTKFFIRKVHKQGNSFQDEHGKWQGGQYVVEVVALPNT